MKNNCYIYEGKTQKKDASPVNGLKSLATASALKEDFQYISFLMAKSLVLQVNDMI